MATTYKVLAQSAPAATTNTDIYTVGAGKQTIISTLIVCNRNAAGSFRIAIRPDGAAIANLHYIAYDVPVGANDSTTLTLGLTLDASDVVTVYASSANLTFSIFGAEIA